MLGSLVVNSLLVYYTGNSNGIYIMLLIILENLDYFVLIINKFWVRLGFYVFMIMIEFAIFMFT